MNDVRLNNAALERMIRGTPERLSAVMREVGELVAGDIKTSYGTSPPGRTYRRGSVSHVASRPGYAPNVDTGTLRASVRWEMVGRYTVMIYTGVKYAPMLEYGTERMAARPHFSPVISVWRLRKFKAHLVARGIGT